ncbi:glycine-rich domain-containing protein [Sphingomonas sp. 22R3R2A-7]|uniref:glycine-rich domain-containing protein n=1 Tax=Sphingomonas sp. 22R3R2A-7 TaxID=3050230 RepID=UPI002FE17EC1
MTTIVEYLKAGTTAWTVPEGVSSVKVECLGAGGRGRTVNGSTSSGNRRSSGGGGGYSSSTLTVVPGTVIPVQVGTNTASWFSSNTTVLGEQGR